MQIPPPADGSGIDNSTHTSSKVRTIVPIAIASSTRPITVHELERWIATNEPDLWWEVSNKCYDYVRVILSLASPETVLKFRCTTGMPGVDKRAVFYGLPDATYDASWKATNRPKQKVKVKRRRLVRHRLRTLPLSPSSTSTSSSWPVLLSPEESTSPSNPTNRYPVREVAEKPTATAVTFTENHNIALQTTSLSCTQVSESVDHRVAQASWRVLHSLFDFKDPIWQQLLHALDDVKTGTENGETTENMINSAINKYHLLQQACIRNDAITILCREITINKELMTCSPGSYGE